MKDFNIEQYLPNLSIDCVIFGYQDKELKILIAKSKFGKKSWNLPGGYIKKTESIEKAASRILNEKTSLKKIFLEQFKVFGDKDRIVKSSLIKILKQEFKKFDPKIFTTKVVEWMTGRFVCIGYYALVDIHKVQPQAGDFDEYIEWRSIKDIPAMMHDHSEITLEALKTLRQNFDEKLIGFNLLPDTFTMKELQELYEAVFDRTFANNNFQKKMLDQDVLVRLEKKFTGAQNKAPYLYQFKKKLK